MGGLTGGCYRTRSGSDWQNELEQCPAFAVRQDNSIVLNLERGYGVDDPPGKRASSCCHAIALYLRTRETERGIRKKSHQ
jgi:hypothetical protein